MNFLAATQVRKPGDNRTFCNPDPVYRCRHFDVRELVGPEVYSALGEDLCWILLNKTAGPLLRGIDWLRDEYGPATINNWHYHKDGMTLFTESGLRTPIDKHHRDTTAHAMLGSHGGFDLKFLDVTAEYVRQDLKDRVIAKEFVHPSILRIEEAVSWLHVDNMPHFPILSHILPGKHHSLYLIHV